MTTKGYHQAQEHKDKIGEASRKRIWSQESRDKASRSHRGVCLSQEHKDKIAEAGRGRQASPETIAKLSGSNNHFFGKIHTKETGVIIAEANRKRIWSQESKDKMSESGKARKPASQETRTKMRESKSGIKNPAYIDGRSFLPYLSEFNEELKESIRKRDHRECQFPFCKERDKERSGKLNVHHIDYDKRNSIPENLITLCVKHNTVVNSHREDWELYFQRALAIREGVERRVLFSDRPRIKQVEEQLVWAF